MAMPGPDKCVPPSPVMRAAFERRRVELERGRDVDPYAPLKAVPSTLLPADVRDELTAASSLPNPDQRRLAVHQAIERAHDRYPELFRKDPAHG